jgi:predicted PurR-regulated permease PerM
MDKQVSITITPGTIIMTIVIGALAFAFWSLRDLFLLVVTAVVLASAIEPGVAFFVRYRVPRALSVLIMYLIVFGSLFSIVYLLFPPLIDDTQNFISGVPQYLDTLNLPQSLGSAPPTFFMDTQNQGQSILDTLFIFRSAFSDTGEGAIRLLSTFFGGIFSLILVIVLSFYFALQETGVEDFLRTVTPQKHEEYIVSLWKRAHTKIGLWMQGQLLLSLIVGVIVYLGLLILGVPYALLLAILAAIFDLIPIFGSFIAGILAVIVAFSTGGVSMAIAVSLLYVIVNQFEAHLIYPLVVNKVVGIPPLLVILALIAGGALAGFLGVLLAVPLAAALREFVSDLDRGKRARATSA